jgi:hypothetical protein
MFSVQINELVLSGGEASSGWWVTQDGLTGWWDSLEPKHEVDARPTGYDGSWMPADLNVRSRVLEVRGAHQSSTSAEAEAEARDFLADLVVRELFITVTDYAGEVRSATGVMRGQVKVRHLDDVTCEFSMVIECPDPFKYGPEVSVSTGLPSAAGGFSWPLKWPIGWGARGDSGRLVLPNVGRQGSWPRFTVTGGLDAGFSLTCVDTGDEIRFEFPMAETDYVSLDSATGQVWINDPGNNASGFLTRSEWFVVPAKGTRTVQFNRLGGSSGSPVLTGVVAPAYL